MTVPSSLELLAEFEAAKKTAQALFRRAAKNMPSAVGVTQQAIQEALGNLPGAFPPVSTLPAHALRPLATPQSTSVNSCEAPACLRIKYRGNKFSIHFLELILIYSSNFNR